jgi:hypothetical protein
MLIADIRAKVSSYCGRSNAEFTVNIDAWVNNIVKERLMLLYDLWFMDSESTIPTVAATQNYALPTNFKDVKQEGVVYRDSNGSCVPLDVISEQEALSQWEIDAVGAPEAIVIKESTYDVWPIPDDIYNIDWDCSVFLADLSDANTSNYLSINYPDVYINGGNYKGFQFLEEYERATYWEGELQKSIDKILAYNTLRRLGKISLSFSANSKAHYRNSRSDQ